MNTAKVTTCNNYTGTLVRQRHDTGITKEAGQQETRDTYQETLDIHPIKTADTVPVNMKLDAGPGLGQRGINTVTPMKSIDQMRQGAVLGRDRGRGSNMVGFRLAADMLAQANRHERVITTGKSPFE